MPNILYIIRGVSGSGKTKFANTLGCPVYSADDYFMVDGEYKFLPSLMPDAHTNCKNRVRQAMYDGSPVLAVANTFTQEWEMEDYFYLASSNDYIVFSLIVENRHGGKNVHDVPDDAVEKQRERFEIKL